jgi:hypothetical protein
MRWFIDLLQLGHEVWIGDAAQIHASYVRNPEEDRCDADPPLGATKA